MENMRTRYQPIIRQLQDRIDQASYDWAYTGCERALTEYTMLVTEVSEIKQAIKDNEDK